MARYRGFAQLEYEYVRERVYPAFDWRSSEHPSPRRRLSRPVNEARVALVATAGAYLAEQPPFRLTASGDSSYRELPAGASDLRLAHVGYNTRRARQDPDVVFPLGVLRRLAEDGEIGELAPRAFSFMGYIPEVEALVEESGPEVAAKLISDAVDLVLLVPS